MEKHNAEHNELSDLIRAQKSAQTAASYCLKEGNLMEAVHNQERAHEYAVQVGEMRLKMYRAVIAAQPITVGLGRRNGDYTVAVVPVAS